MPDTYADLTDDQLAARMRIAVRVLLRAESHPAQLAWALYIKANVDRENTRRAVARGLAERGVPHGPADVDAWLALTGAAQHV